MPHDSLSRAAVASRWLRESLKLGVACAAGFGAARWLASDDPAPPDPALIASAGATNLKAGAPPDGGTATAPHLDAARRVADAIKLARTDMEAFQRRLAGTTDAPDRLLLIRGLFAHYADSLSPPDAIRKALEFEKEEQDAALRELAAVWLGVSPDSLSGDPQRTSAVLRAGLALIRSAKARPGTAEAWIAAFRQHPARLELVSAFAGVLSARDPERALSMAEGLTEWERARFLGSVTAAWARHDPDAARRWLADPAHGATDEDRRGFWRAVTYSQPEWAAAALAREGDPAARLEAIRGMAAIKVHQGTREAVAWADSLPNPAERELAHDIIYEGTPRGISAVLDARDGYPEIREALPGGAAARAGMQRGDRIVEVTSADGRTVSLYNQPLEVAVKNLQGEAGESVTLRFLRNGPGGTPLEQTVTVVRSQIVLPPEMVR